MRRGPGTDKRVPLDSQGGHGVSGRADVDPASRLPVLIIRVYNSGLEGVLGSGGFDAEAIHGGVSSG